MKEINSLQQKALLLQKKIYKKLQIEVNEIFGVYSKSIQSYQREYNQDFPSPSQLHKIKFKPLPTAKLIQSIQKSDITWIADFHTFDQAQRTALRMMRRAIQPQIRNPKITWLIGLELVSSHLQPILDQFQQGKISIQKFQKAIAYQTDWGFPWQNYAPLFEWACTQKIRLIALNRPSPLILFKNKEDLELRDQWAAGIIIDLFQEYLQKKLKPKMIVLYGEYHVGSQHLPKQIEILSKPILKNKLKTITHHQNNDSLYWKVAKQPHPQNYEILKLKKNHFCILSGTPWSKLQSLLNWTDTNDDRDDIALFQQYGSTLAQFFDLTMPTYDSLHVIAHHKNDQFQYQIQILLEDSMLLASDRTWIQNHIREHRYFLIPQLDIAYFDILSHNHMAELAAIHLFKKYHHCKKLVPIHAEDLNRIILEAAFGFFSSLIFNPRRKWDHDEKQLELLHKRLKKKPNVKLQLHERFPFATQAYQFGQLLGKRLHLASTESKISLTEIHELFFKSPSSDNFSDQAVKTLLKLTHSKTLQDIEAKNKQYRL